MAGQVKINQGRLEAVVGSRIRQAAENGANTLKRRVEGNIVAYGLIDTGRLLHSIRVQDLNSTGLIARFRVYSNDDKAKYPEFGTRGSVAAPGHVLAFRVHGVLIFRKRTGPVPEFRYFRNARDSMNKRDFHL